MSTALGHDCHRCHRPAHDDQLRLEATGEGPEARTYFVHRGRCPFEHVTAEGDLFLVPDGYVPDEHSARCRSCEALIVWVVTPRGKRAPMDPDGHSHFVSCPQRDQWRKPR